MLKGRNTIYGVVGADSPPNPLKQTIYPVFHGFFCSDHQLDDEALKCVNIVLGNNSGSQIGTLTPPTSL
jgi:hypothetical protein